MEPRRLFLTLGLGLGALLVAGLLLWPRAARELAPELLRARVAIQPAGEEVARTGQVQMAAGSEFTVHAVLEARTRGGEALFYTAAPRLVVDGTEVPAGQLRPWDRRESVKVMWFTVEGAVPYLKVDRAEVLERFRFTEFLHLDWPRSWAVPGRIDAANDDRLQREPGTAEPTFGTQRFQVRIELYDPDSPLVPAARYASPGGDRLEEDPESVTTAVVSLPGAAGPASRFFGLTHLDLALDTRGEGLERVTRLTRRRLAYSQVPLLSELLAAGGVNDGEVSWRRVDLDGDTAWGSDAGPGDLLRAAAVWVVLYEDAGAPGRLDRDDLCFDFNRGAVIRPLAQVFAGGGEVELARLAVPGP